MSQGLYARLKEQEDAFASQEESQAQTPRDAKTLGQAIRHEWTSPPARDRRRIENYGAEGRPILLSSIALSSPYRSMQLLYKQKPQVDAEVPYEPIR